MRISQIKIENLRSFKNQTIALDKYACLIGANGAGKSTILLALRMFFGDWTSLDTNISILQEEDFHQKSVANPVRVTLTFVELESEAREEFKDYFRQGELVVCAEATWDPETKNAKVRRHGWRNVNPRFAPYFAAKGDKQQVSVLRDIYKGIRVDVSDLPDETTEPKMTAALRAYEESHPKELELLPSDDQFFGISAGVDRFRRYLQWIFIPAMKDALEEQSEGKNTVLGQILARTVRATVNFDTELQPLRSEANGKYRELLKSKEETLGELTKTLRNKLQDWAHPDCSLFLRWTNGTDNPVRIDPPYAETTGGEGSFQGKLTRFGHGFHRSYIFALLHVLSDIDDVSSPTLILGCEEPELFQHPPQLRHLAGVFRKLSEGNSQIVLCTHSPYFVTGEDFEDVRLVRKTPTSCESKVSCCTVGQIGEAVSQAYPDNPPEKPMGALLKIHQSLQPELNEMFFAQTVVFVEGLEDASYLTTYMHLLEKWEEFRRLGCHIVAARGKSSLVRPLAVANILGIPRFVVFDSDNHVPDNGHGNRDKHEKDNRALLFLLGAASKSPFPSDNEWGEDFVMWKSEIGRVVSEELTPYNYSTTLDRIRKRYGDSGNLDKDSLFIADALEEAWRNGGKCHSLVTLCSNILNYARNRAEGG